MSEIGEEEDAKLIENRKRNTVTNSKDWWYGGYWAESTSFIGTHWVPLLANAFEWFEFATFAYLVDPIAENFAKGDHLSIWLIFSIAFLVRPLGGVLIGILGDGMGRKPAFWVASVTVVCSTVLQGCLPSYYTGGQTGAHVGLAFLLLLRISQGLGIGGELGSSVIYLAETSPRGYVGMTMAWLGVSSGLGFLAASFVAATLNSALTNDEIYEWGWRLPFLLALFPGILVVHLLGQIHETPVFEEDVQGNGNAAGNRTRGQALNNSYRDVDSLSSSWPRILALVLMVSGAASFWYVGCVYVFDWIREQSDNPDSRTMKDLLWVAVLQNAVSLPSGLYAGYLTDRYGLRLAYPLIMGSALCAGLPVFALLDTGFSITLLIIGPGIVFGLISGGLGTATSLLSADLFPPKLRHRSVGLAYNASICLFGGLGPAWVELARPSIPLAGGYFLLLTAATSVIVFQLVGESYLPKITIAD